MWMRWSSGCGATLASAIRRESSADRKNREWVGSARLRMLPQISGCAQAGSAASKNGAHGPSSCAATRRAARIKIVRRPDSSIFSRLAIAPAFCSCTATLRSCAKAAKTGSGGTWSRGPFQASSARTVRERLSGMIGSYTLLSNTEPRGTIKLNATNRNRGAIST